VILQGMQNAVQKPEKALGLNLGDIVSRNRQYMTIAVYVVAVIVLFVIGVFTIPGFSRPYSIESMLIISSFLGIAAAGQTMVILLGGIDLSVPGAIGLSEVCFTVLTANGFPLWETALIVMSSAIAIGLINGGICGFLNLNPIIVSLGVGFMINGGVLVWTSGGAAQGVIPGVFKHMDTVGSSLGPIPLPPVIVIWFVVAILLVFLQYRTVLGKRLYALGSNEHAATLMLANRRIMWPVAFIISALSGALTGMLLSGFSGGADFSIGDPYLFTGIAAVVVGGTSLLGGSGGYERTFLGSLIVTEISTILVGYGLGVDLQQVLLGALILLIVAAIGREVHIRYRI
jgi:ribose transport system permease protein